MQTAAGKSEEAAADDIKMEDAPAAAEAESPADANAAEEDDSQSPPDSKETGTPENVSASLHIVFIMQACLLS